MGVRGAAGKVIRIGPGEGATVRESLSIKRLTLSTEEQKTFFKRSEKKEGARKEKIKKVSKKTCIF